MIKATPKKIRLGAFDYAYCVSMMIDGKEVELMFNRSIAGINTDFEMAKRICEVIND